jgi:hypothetical protein
MAYNHSLLRKEIRDVVKATWPEITIILDVLQGERRAYSGVTIPFAVMARGRSESADWGIGNLAYERTIGILYVCAWDDSDIDVVEQKLELLKSALFTASYAGSGATLLSEPELDVTPENPANGIILSKNLQIMGGTLTMRYVCGETATAGL